jgi:Alpha/beta hydrolase domain
MRPSRSALAPLLATAASAALAAGLLTAVAPSVSATPRSTVPLPSIAPIPGGVIFTGAQQDLDALGYTEREYVVGITNPQVYRYAGKSVRTLVKSAPLTRGGYKSRIIVRAPEDPADFNGRVLVEMMNTTSFVDLDIAWQQAHEYLVRDGWAYVAITVQQTGINALKQFTRQPKRYTGLGLNLLTPAAAKDAANGARDPSLAWDLTSQVGALIAQEGASSPLAGYDVESLYLTGQSQMAGYVTTYVRAIHPRHRVYDGFLVAYRGYTATNLQYAKPVAGEVPSTSASVTQRTLRGSGAPVISLQSESDPLRLPDAAGLPAVSASLWRADADTPADRFRLWEVAGSSHNDRWGSEQALGILVRDFQLPFTPACPWTAPAGVNDFPMRFAWHRALDALAAWHESGTPPASGARLQRDSAGVVQRDDDGNALGGIRMPRIEVPVATYTPTTQGPLFCPLTGTQTPFAADDLATRYPTTAAYVAEVQAKVAQSIADGFLLREDGASLIQSARRGPAAEAETIQKY